MENKKFLSIDEQINLLISRGLNIEDKEAAKSFLYKNNYYRVSGYTLTLRKHDIFFSGVSFSNVEDIYNFDYEFRHILLKYLEIIENNIKSIYAHEFTKVYGPLGYLDKNYFSDVVKHQEII